MIRNYANEANLIRGFHKCVRFNGRGKNDTFSLDNSSQSRKVAVESMINKGYITKKSNKVNFVGKIFTYLRGLLSCVGNIPLKQSVLRDFKREIFLSKFETRIEKHTYAKEKEMRTSVSI